MRSWYPIKAKCLDNKRLLGEHNELLIMARAIAGLNKGYRNHPETKRWQGHSYAMKLRHDEIAKEMLLRGFNHKSPWPDNVLEATDTESWPNSYWESIEIMEHKLREKQGYVITLERWPV